MRAFGLLSLPLGAASPAGPPSWWPTITVEIGFTETTPGVPVWTDVTDYVTSLSTRRGRDDELQTFQAGTMSVQLDNRDGRFDPTNTLSPYSPNVKPMRQIRARCAVPASSSYGAATYYLFTGFIENWTPTWVSSWAQTVQLDCVDALAGYALFPYSGTRSAESPLNRLVGVVGTAAGTGLPALVSSGAYLTSGATMPAKTYDRASILEVVQEAELAEMGAAFILASGPFRFENRYYRSQLSLSTIFTDSPISTNAIEYDQVELAYGASYLYNDVKVTDASSNVGEHDDATSIEAYGRRGLDRSVELDSALQTQSMAEYLVARYGQPRLRATRVVVSPAPMSSATSQPWHIALQAAEISKRVEVVGYRAGSAFDEEYVVEGVTHDIDANGSWTISYALSPFPTEAFWVLDQSALGSTTVLAY